MVSVFFATGSFSPVNDDSSTSRSTLYKKKGSAQLEEAGSIGCKADDMIIVSGGGRKVQYFCDSDVGGDSVSNAKTDDISWDKLRSYYR